jgi:hypothetical protein
MVGNEEDFLFWRSSRQRWTRDAVEALARASVDDALVRNFERATSVPASAGLWAEDLGLELERVHEGVKLLGSLVAARDS